MAQHRKPPGQPVPAELITYDKLEWAQPDDASWQPFERWKAARHAWVKTHGNESILGTLLDVMIEEHNLRMERLRNGNVAS